mmetsp:Transcript_82733/g.266721  ORF Transcript_82733/g.266721 Transcript_82733/m.266721 type:complete len:215 (-) Transcript_82733:6-650(-)
MHLLTLPGRQISLAIRCLYLQVAQDKLHALTGLGGDLLVHTVQGTDDQASLYHELHVEVPLASASAEEFVLPSTTMEHLSVYTRPVETTLSSLCTRVSSRSSSTSRPNSPSKRASSDSSPRPAPGASLRARLLVPAPRWACHRLCAPGSAAHCCELVIQARAPPRPGRRRAFRPHTARGNSTARNFSTLLPGRRSSALTLERPYNSHYFSCSLP